MPAIPIARRDARPPCTACGRDCRSAWECRRLALRTGGAGSRSRTVVLTPLGWALSKYGRDPRKDAP